jgi:hypothetical protein
MVADEFIRFLPFVSSTPEGRPYSEQYVLRAEGALQEPSFATIGHGTPWTAGASFSFAQSLDGRSARRRFKRLSVFIEIDELMVDESGSRRDVLELEARLAATSLIRALSAAVMQSSPKPPDTTAASADHQSDPDVQEFTGLPASIAGTDQDVAWDETSGIIDGLAAIEALCHPSDGDFGGQPDVFVMSSRARWRLLHELEHRAITPDFHMSAMTGRTQFHFHGIPVLSGRVREEADSGTTDAWAIKLYGPTGIRVLHVGGNPAAYGVQVEETLISAPKSSGESRGIVTIQKGVEVFGIFSLVIPELQSAARLSGIPAKSPINSSPSSA